MLLQLQTSVHIPSQQSKTNPNSFVANLMFISTPNPTVKTSLGPSLSKFTAIFET